jgi:NAD(P)-dependent dehydrogenase (short-subunit alcohol dehydrogenase family)
MHASQRVLITGASSGIGRALAEACAGPGVTLHIGGRDQARLEDVTRSCQARGAEVRALAQEITDRAAMARWIAEAGGIDLVFANAGISAGTGLGEPESAAQARAIFATNLDGVLNTVLPAIEVMRVQPPAEAGVRGRIAVVASIAAFLPSPAAPAYCASKAAIDAWTVATAPSLRRQGILLTSLCPGFVRTAMTAGNPFPMPGLMDAERAARIILRGVAAGRVRVAFPWWMATAARIVDLIPVALTGRLLARLPGKGADPELK